VVFSGGSLLALLFAIAEVIVLRVVITDSSLFVKHAWSSRKFPLTDLRSMRMINFEYVIKASKRSLIWIPMTISQRPAIIDRLNREIAANLANEMSSVTSTQRASVRKITPLYFG